MQQWSYSSYVWDEDDESTPLLWRKQNTKWDWNIIRFNSNSLVHCTSSPTLAMSSPLLPSGDLPEGLLLPDVIITRRTRTVSMSGRIDHNVIQEGTIRFFCRSKGHGFIDPIVKVGICSLYFGCPMVPFSNFEYWILTSSTLIMIYKGWPIRDD